MILGGLGDMRERLNHFRQITGAGVKKRHTGAASLDTLLHTVKIADRVLWLVEGKRYGQCLYYKLNQ